MPYVSNRQRRFFHTDTAKKQGITPEMVNEYDQASKGMNLPESAASRVAKKMVAAKHGRRAATRRSAAATTSSTAIVSASVSSAAFTQPRCVKIG